MSSFTVKLCLSIKRLFPLSLVSSANFQLSNCPGIAKKSQSCLEGKFILNFSLNTNKDAILMGGDDESI